MSHCKHLSLVLVLGLALAGCNKPSVDLSALQDEIAELKAQFEEARKEASKLRNELASVATFKDRVSTSLSEFSRQQKEVIEGMDQIKDQFMAYRDEYKANVRERAAGMLIPDFDALGRTFKNVIVKSVDDWELAFKHANGMTRMNFADAPPEVRILFAYNPNVGPKPQKVVVMPAGTTPVEDLTFIASARSETSDPSTLPAGDPFATAPAPASVGAAIGLNPALVGNDTPTFKKPVRPPRKVVFRDGTACEIIAEF